MVECGNFVSFVVTIDWKPRQKDWRSKDYLDEINEWVCSAVTFSRCPVHKPFERVELFKLQVLTLLAVCR